MATLELAVADVDFRYHSLAEPCCRGTVYAIDDFVMMDLSSNSSTVGAVLASTNP